MPTATAHAFASAFFKRPVERTPEPWSGRLDPDGLKRPGGLLIAALMQSADERGLSLSELATAMGVSYWSLSQLRIGFRPIDALDDDVAEACAAWLDLPRLTVEMLAGLLNPAEALAAQPLTSEDILHACQLRDTDPANLLLLPPSNRARPLQSLSVDELAGLHRNHGANPAVADALRAELASRPVSKTERLRAALAPLIVEAAENAAVPDAPEAATPTPPILRCASCQTRLRIPVLDGPGEVRCPSCQTEYAVHWQGTVCLVQRIEAPADGSQDADDAAPERDEPAGPSPWAVLGLADNSAWEAVERARRTLLQQYHPDRLGHVSPLVQKLAEDAFKRVGDAYEALKAQR